MSNQNNYIVLGEPLDQLLNATCVFPFQCTFKDNDITYKKGGLKKPTATHPGTGNIVIAGEAGTGKSTLALQILCEAARRNDNIFGAYISLEEEPMQIFQKAHDYGWSAHVSPLNHILARENRTTSEDLKNNLNIILETPTKCYSRGSKDCNYKGDGGFCKNDNCLFSGCCEKKPLKPEELYRFTDSPGKIILPQLAPRLFCKDRQDQNQGDDLFWIRFHQIETLLKAATGLQSEAYLEKDLRLVCIDSLNVLGAGGLTRDHLASLFDLFHRHQTLGVFIVEENKRGVFAGDSPIDSDTIDFLTDMVIKLTTREEEGYWLRHMQVMKSRYQKQALGRHPIKIRGVEDKQRDYIEKIDYSEETSLEARDEDKRRQPSGYGVRVFPSVHLIVTMSDRVANSDPDNSKKPINPANRDYTFWTSKNLNNLIQFHAIHSNKQTLNKENAHIVTVTGPATTGKSLIAGNFLLKGLQEKQDVVLIRLGEHTDFTTNGMWSSDDQESTDYKDYGLRPFKEKENESGPNEFSNLLQTLKNFDSQKIQAAIKQYGIEKEGNDKDPVLIELAVKPGFFLPEVFIAALRLIYRWEMRVRQPFLKNDKKTNNPFGIDRIVFMEVGQIGVGYPMLRKSSTAAELFLSSFVHILKCRHTDLLMTAQTGGHAASEEMVKKAISLADEVISCDHCDVFGDRYVTVTGPRLIEDDMENKNTPETVPYVLRRQRGPKGKEDFFLIDNDKLAGLVGFSSGHIRRPGVILQVFQEGCLHKDYNENILSMVSYALAAPHIKEARHSINTRDEPSVVVDTFDSLKSGPFHQSLKLLKSAPLHNTLLRTIDEFAIHGNQQAALKRAGFKDPTQQEEDPTYNLRRTKYEDQLNYGSTYYRNVLLMVCDKETKKDFKTLLEKINARTIKKHEEFIIGSLKKLFEKPKPGKKTVFSTTELFENYETLLETHKSICKLKQSDLTDQEELNKLSELYIQLCKTNQTIRDDETSFFEQLIALIETVKVASALHNRDQKYAKSLFDSDEKALENSAFFKKCNDEYSNLCKLGNDYYELTQINDNEELNRFKKIIKKDKDKDKHSVEIDRLIDNSENTEDPNPHKIDNLIKFKKSFLTLLEKSAEEIGSKLPKLITNNTDGSNKSAFDFWQNLYTSLYDDDKPKKNCKTSIYCDRRAKETLSCLTLDGLLSLTNELAIEHRQVKLKEVGETLIELNKKIKVDDIKENNDIYHKSLYINKQVESYIKYLQEVLILSKPIMDENSLDERSQTPALSDFFKENVLKNNSSNHSSNPEGSKRFIIFCWYSHLREILHLSHEAQKANNQYADIAKEMHVLSLPGGGFTGDWYLDVHPGSVSESLGQKIKNSLLNPQADFERFSSGVGLPSAPRKTSEFGTFPILEKADNADKESWEKAKSRYDELKRSCIENHLKGWPGSETNLSTVMQIHQFANRRSKIKGYQEIRGALFSLMKLHLSEVSKDGKGTESENLYESIIELLGTTDDEQNE